MKLKQKKTSSAHKATRNYQTPKKNSAQMNLSIVPDTGASDLWGNGLKYTTHKEIQGLDLKNFWEVDSGHELVSSNDDKEIYDELHDLHDDIGFIGLFDGHDDKDSASLDQACKV